MIFLTILFYFLQIAFFSGSQPLPADDHLIKFKRQCVKSFLFLTRPPSSELKNGWPRTIDCPPKLPSVDPYEYRPDEWLLPSAESNPEMQLNRLVNTSVKPVSQDLLTFELIGGGQGSGRVILDYGNGVIEDGNEWDSANGKRRRREPSQGTSVVPTKSGVTEKLDSSMFSTLAESQNSLKSLIINGSKIKSFQEDDNEMDYNYENYNDIYYSDSDDDDDIESSTDLDKISSRIISAQPRTISAQPRIISAQPRIISTQPRIISTQPGISSAQSGIISAQPRIISAKPRIISVQPRIISAQKSGLNDTFYKLPQVSNKPLIKARNTPVDFNYDSGTEEKCSTLLVETKRPRTRKPKKITTTKLKSTTTIHWNHDYHHKGHDCHYHYKNHSSRHEQNYYKHEPLHSYLTDWILRKTSSVSCLTEISSSPAPEQSSKLNKTVYTLNKGGTSRKPSVISMKPSILSLFLKELLFPKKEEKPKKKQQNLLSHLVSQTNESLVRITSGRMKL